MPSGDDLLQEAMRLCQAGKKQEAGHLLVTFIRLHPENELGWWFLTACVDTPQKQRDCLNRVIKINPNHLGARLFLDQLDNNIPLPNLGSPLPDSESRGSGESDGYSVTAPFASFSLPVEKNPQVEQLLDQARVAEKAKDFRLAFDLYTSVLEFETGCSPAWLGKGYAAGRLSTPEFNRIPEFFDNFSRAVLLRDQLGLMIREAITRLDPEFAQLASDRLLQLAGFTGQLALITPQPMANVYAVERVHLTDWAYVIGKSLGTQSGLWCSRAELVGVAQEAYQRIISNIMETTPGTRARREVLLTLRNYLLSNLSFSGLDRDVELLHVLIRMGEEAVI